MFVEGVEALICKSLRHWWAEHYEASLDDLVQKPELLIGLQGSGAALQQNFGHKSRMKRKQTYGAKNERSRVLNVKNSRLSEEGSNQAGSTSGSHSFDNTNILTAELVAAVESGEFDVDDTKSIDSLPYCKVYMNGYHRT